MKIKPIFSFVCFISLLLIGCDKEGKKLDIESFAAPTVSVSQVNVSSESVAVVLKGSVSTPNINAVISECGFYYYPDNLKEQEKKVPATVESGAFSLNLLLKDYGNTYRYRAYVSNGVNETVSDEMSFKLHEFQDYVNITAPVVVSSDGSSVTVKSVFKLAVGVSPTESGILYGRSERLTVDSLHAVSAEHTTDINVTLKDLTLGKSYYIRPYVREGDYIAYGDIAAFVTHSVPSISTAEVYNVDYHSATTGGFNLKTNGLDLLSRGVAWSTSHNPTVENSFVKTVAGNDVQNFTCELTNLNPGTTYYVRAFATNSDGTGYGEERSFTTTALKKATVITKDVTSITSSSASSGGSITADGGAAVTSRGVVWNTGHNPDVSLSTKTVDGSGTGSFVSQITGLEPGTTYYVRAYATNSAGTAYGDEKSFTTPVAMPVVSTSDVTGVTPSSAVLGGNVVSSGGADVTERGVVWGTSENPTVDGGKRSCGSGTGEFTATVSGLSVATTYYVRAYAVNSAGVSYGNQVSFTTGHVIPSLSTKAVTLVTSGSAVSGGDVIADGGAAVTSRGVVWNTGHNPDVSLSTKTVDGSGTGSFVSQITGLEPGTTYYVRAYATNSVGTAYGDEKSFTTSVAVPVVSTSDVTGITPSSAVLGGNVVSSGGADVTERGVVWGTSENPTVDDGKRSCGSGTGEFTATVSGLSVATTYYVRAYAVNSAGISYGNQISFTTGLVIPSLSTKAVTSVTSSSAVSGGSVTADGGAAVTSRGIVWGTEHNPTTDLPTRTSNGSGTGEFTATISGLEPGTTYYVRAYATNSVGTAYGQEVEFKTDANLPAVTTKPASTVTSSGFTTGGDIASDGGAAVTARGVVWSTTENPTVSLTTKTTDGTGTGSFSSTVSGLKPNTVYYVRAYATNSKGTSYGGQLTVQTRPKGGTEGVDNEEYEW